MDNYNKVKEETTNKVKFSISQGKVEFESQGLDEWQTSEAIHQVSNQIKAATELQKVTAISDMAMHGLALSFFTFLIFVGSFNLSRFLSGIMHTNQSGVLTHGK